MVSAERALLAVGGLLRHAAVSPDGLALYQLGGRDADVFYRDRTTPTASSSPTNGSPPSRARMARRHSTHDHQTRTDQGDKRRA